MRLSPGDYPDLNNMPIERNNIDSMVVPPNMTVTGYERTNYNSGCSDCKRGVFGPGINPDLSKNNVGIGSNDIDSLRIVRNMSWDEFKVRCCNNQGNPSQCKQFWGGSSGNACGNTMRNYCDANRLSSDARCKTWCAANPGQCDTAASQFCASHPTDPFCSCLKSPLRAPSCFDKNCLAGGYRTAAMQEMSSKCPSVIECNQNVTIDKAAYNNIVSDIGMKQTCTSTSAYNTVPDGGSTGSTGSTPGTTYTETHNNTTSVNPTGQGTQYNNTMGLPPPGTVRVGSMNVSIVMLVLLVVVLAAVILVVSMSGDDDDYDQGYEQSYNPGYPGYGYGY
jgi:hypothetical protein